MSPPPPSPPLYTLRMVDRPKGYGGWFSKLVFPLVFDLGMLGINSCQFLLLVLLLIPGGRRWYEAAIDWTKDGFGRLLIAITVLCAPTSLTITTDAPPHLSSLVERDEHGAMTRINLPDRLVIMANHQAYTDWMYLWILACYAGHAEGLTILLKAQLKNLPVVGWGMRFFRFIFLRRSWAADRDNLARSLGRLATRAKSASHSPLWLLIFPEGTICSDDERAKSVRYAEREGVPDLVGVLHPRATGLHFALRTLAPQIPDLKLLDVTIGYPGVPFGAYPQEWYGLGSVFWRGVPPPTVKVHLHLYDLAEIPGLGESGAKTERASTADVENGLSGNGHGHGHGQAVMNGEKLEAPKPTPLGLTEDATAFNLWLRSIWSLKQDRLRHQVSSVHETEPAEVVPITQLRWRHWVAACGAGGMGTAAMVYCVVRRFI